jgi:uncharacterized lipoprotein
MNRHLLLALALALFLPGCALTVDKIDVPYQGRANISVVEGADKVVVDVKNEDKRTVYKDRVGTKKNGYGMEMASIVPTNDIAQTFSDAISTELESLGFKIGPGGKTVKVELIRFYNDFKMGFFSGDSVADALVNVQVLNANGDPLFARSYEGGAIEPNIMVASGSNAKASLVRAMADTVAKIAQDKDLQMALLK